MASTNSITAANITSIIDNSEIRNVDPEFDILELVDTPLIGWIPRKNAIKLGEDLTYEKIVHKALQRTVTNTVAVVTADSTITMSTSDAARLQIGHLLVGLGTNEEIVRLTATHATAPTFTRGFGSVLATTHAQTTSWRVMSPVIEDGATFTQSPSSLGEFKTFLPFVIMYQDNMSPMRSATRTYLERNQDPLAFRMERLNKEKLPEMEALLLHGQTKTISASTAGSPAGIRALISSNSTAVSGALTATHIENMLDTIHGWDGQRKITVIGNKTMHRIWSAVWRQYFDKVGEVVATPKIGFAVRVYESPTMGEIEFLVDEAAKDSELLFLDKTSWGLHPLDWAFGSGWNTFERGPKESNILSVARGLYSAWVFAVSDERRNGKLTSITISTPGTNYPGYV